MGCNPCYFPVEIEIFNIFITKSGADSSTAFFCLIMSTHNIFRKYCWIGLIFIGVHQFYCFNPFAPELNNNIDLSNVITEQRSPDEVLQNFRYSYTFKDSLLYSDVLDEAFVFEYFDTNLEPSGGLRTWGRDVDIKTTGTLFRKFDVIDLVWLNKLFEDCDGGECVENGDEIDYEKYKLVRQFIRFNLNLFSPDENYIFTGTAIFTFQRSPADGKWNIIRWKDETDF